MHISQFYPDTKLNFNVEGITANSKKVRKNFIFVCIKGQKNNGYKFINEALELGACLIISNHHKLGDKFLYVKDPKLEYIRILQIFYNYNQTIYTVGVTGTDGKTTTATILSYILNKVNNSAYLGTNGLNYLNKHIDTINTTPGPEFLYPAYQTLQKQSIHDLVMEVSSEGILDNRIYNFNFQGAIFTNLTHEHLNTHKTMNQYFLCKMKLFEQMPKNSLAVINADEKFSTRIRYYTKAKIVTYGFNHGDYKITNYKIFLDHSIFDVYYKSYYLGTFYTNLFGKYNMYNLLACISYAYEIGIDIQTIKSAIKELKQVKGRFMVYEKKNKTFIIDYAHTPNALENLISNIKSITNRRIIHITGAQGEKDTTKRSKMGLISTNLADITIFTSEDPKNESLFNIFIDLIKDIKDKDYYLTLSRYEAISLAIKIAKDDDIILITGKGEENTEKIGKYIFHHSDLDLIKEALNS